MEKQTRRRLRSASVPLGALTVLALTLAGCDSVGDDDDDDGCAMGPIGGGGTVVMAMRAPGASAGNAAAAGSTALSAPVPERGGFGTHLAYCGG